MLCENPIAEKSYGRVFILHNREPRILAEVHHFNISEADSPQALEIKKAELGAALDYEDEYILFAALWLYPSEKLSQKEPQAQADELAGIMRRMADWYKNYLIWEDSQEDF